MNAIATNSSKMNSIVIDYTQSIMPLLWKFLDKRRRPCFISMNVYTIDNELVISIIDKVKIRRFKSSNNQNLIEKLKYYLKVK